MSMYIQEKVQKIDHLLTEFRTSPEIGNGKEYATLMYCMKTVPMNLIEQIERFAFYDEAMRFWLEENKGADMAELTHEILSIFIRHNWPSLTQDSLDELKIILPDEKYNFVINEIENIITHYV